ncbi:guanylate kinase [Sodalis-like secondary symbiont of Drepanosiphum platanoidis]|uniref:guanylate kinase n=1 Tax=Sodalis-like secondary symbiont of Drepanosiphum platanoidis TaxID=2994493 RepID=UPI00346416D7
MNLGTLYIISAPSGAGKSTLIKKFIKIKSLYKFYFSVSYTTRNIRINEFNKKHYYFITKKKFHQMKLKNYFLEYEKIFNNYYGTSKKKIKNMLKKGIDVFLDINWKGAQTIRKKISNTKSIFILPPSKNELEKRLYKRGKDSKNSIIERIYNSKEEIKHYYEYDYLIINKDINIALQDLKHIYFSNKLELNKQKKYYSSLIKKLITD